MKQTIIHVKNLDDDDCLYSALFIGLVYYNRKENNTFELNNDYFNISFDEKIFLRKLSDYKKTSKDNLYYYTQ